MYQVRIFEKFVTTEEIMMQITKHKNAKPMNIFKTSFNVYSPNQNGHVKKYIRHSKGQCNVFVSKRAQQNEKYMFKRANYKAHSTAPHQNCLINNFLNLYGAGFF